MKKIYSLCLCIICVFVFNLLSAQTIFTLAGNNVQGFGGDGGGANTAKLNSPIGVAVDPNGNVYISDTQNHRIRKVTAAGVITTFAGTGVAGFSGDGAAATAAKINQPCGICLDTAGNVYFADRFNNRIRMIDKTGMISTVAGSTLSAGFSGDGGPATSAALNIPGGVSVDRAGNIYIADTNNDRVRKVQTNDTIITIAGGGSLSGENILGTTISLATPWDVAVDTLGNIYVTDSNNNRIRKINSSGFIVTIAGNGMYGFAGDGGNATAAQFRQPYGVEVDKNQLVYIADTHNGRIRKINALGKISTVAGSSFIGYGGDGGIPTAANLNVPTSIAIEGNGDVYIADDNNHVIRKICQTACLAGIASVNTISDNLLIYPNPNNGAFNLQANTELEHGKLILINTLGQIVFEQIINNGSNFIQTPDLKQGLYNYVLFDNEKRVLSGKILVQ